MATVGLTIYSFKLSNPFKPQEYDLGNVKGKEITSYIYEYFKNNAKKYVDEEKQEKVFKTEEAYLGTASVGKDNYFNYLHTVIKSGSYGIESEIVNPQEGTVSHKKLENEAEVMPFAFSIFTVKGKSTGILVVQSIGIYGITTLLKDKLNDIIRDYVDSNIKILYLNTMPREYLSALMDSKEIKSIKLFKYLNKADKSDRTGLIPYDCRFIEEIYHYPKALKKEEKKKLLDCFSNRYDINNLIGIENAEYDNMKLEFKVGNSTKTVTYSGFANLTVTEDISDKVDIVGGHPTLQSLIPVLNSTGKNYLLATNSIIDFDEIEYNHKLCLFIRKSDEKIEVIEKEYEGVTI